MNTEKKINKSLIIISALGLLSIGGSAYKYLVAKNFNITINVPCDSVDGSCFIETEGEESDGYKIYVAKYSSFNRNIVSYNDLSKDSFVYCGVVASNEYAEGVECK